MEFLNRLQFVHCDTLFATREDAIKYVESMHNIQRPALYAEPMVLKYGQESNPSIILAIGSIGTGVADMANKTFFIDLAYVDGKLVELEELVNANKEDIENIKNILENIKMSCGFNENGEYVKSENDILKDATNLTEANEILARYIQALETRLALFVENTNSLELTLTKTDEGMTLKGDVLLAKNIIVNNKLVQPNILLSDNHGLFVNVELDYQSDINSLVFGVNGVNKEIQLPQHINVESGIYTPDTEEIILTMNNGDMVKIGMGELIREWTVKEDSNTPIVLSLEQVTSEDLAHGAKKWQDILTADVRISDDAHAPFNILTKDEDGRSLRVDGLANKIQYQVADKQYITVQEAIDNIDFEYNAATNNLTFTFANKEVKTVPLNSVQLLDEIRYDANTESIIIIYKDVYNKNQKITIPVGDLIAEWEVENAEHTVTLAKTRNVQGLDVLTADVNVSEKGLNNNILEVLNGKLYVNGIADNIKYENTTVKSAIDTLDKKSIANANAIAQNTEDIAKENAERIAKDEEHGNEILNLNEAVNINKQNIADEIVRSKAAEDKIEASIGLSEDGSFIKNAVNYGGEAVTIGAEIAHLDVVLKNTTDKVDGNINKTDDLKKEVEDLALALENEVTRATNVEKSIEVKSEEIKEVADTNAKAIAEEKTMRESEDNIIKEMIGKSTDSSAVNSVYGAIKAEEEARLSNDEEIKNFISKLAIKKLDTPTNETVAASYALVDVNGIQYGATIDVLKDKFLQSVALDGDNMNFEFITANGSVNIVTINVAEFLKEAEFNTSAGLSVEGGVVSIKLSSHEESVKYLTFADNGGVEVKGIDAAIKTAIDSEYNRAVAKETELASLIKTEESRAIDVEKTLSDAITELNQEKDVVKTDISSIQEHVNEVISKVGVLETKAAEVDKTISTLATQEELQDTETTVKDYADSLVLTKGVAIDIVDKTINVKVSESTDNLIQVVDDALYVSNDNIKAEYQEADKLVEDKIAIIDERVKTIESTPFTTIDEVNATVKANTNKVVNANNTIGIQTVVSATEGTEYQLKVNVSEIEGNILAQTNTDGIYATVGLDYNAATNTLTFKSSNHSNKEIKLNAGTIISGAYYDGESKDLVIEYKIDNVEAIQTVRIPVESFYTPLEVKEGNSTVVLAIEDGKISAKASVSTLASNVLEVDADSALYVNGDNFISKDEYTQGIGSTKTEVKATDNDEHIVVSSMVGVNGQMIYTIGSKNILSEDDVKVVEDKVNALEGVVTTTQNAVTVLQGDVNDIKNDIDAMDVADIEVANQYVSSVSQTNGKIAVTKQILPNYSGQITDSLTEAKQYTDDEITKLSDELKKYADEAGKVKSLTSSDGSITVSSINDNGEIDIVVNNIDFGTY